MVRVAGNSVAVPACALLLGVFLGVSISPTCTLGGDKPAHTQELLRSHGFSRSVATASVQCPKPAPVEVTCACHLPPVTACPKAERAADEQHMLASKTLATSSIASLCPKPVPVFGSRGDLAGILEKEGFTIAAELGVQKGHYAANILSGWSSAKFYLLVDIWKTQDNYHDPANVGQAQQDAHYAEAMALTARWSDKMRVCRNFTTYCAQLYDDEFFDWIYVDARHDRMGARADMQNWWPKLRSGGLMCGHDFVSQSEGPAQGGQRWDINMDGSVDPTGGAVKAAVMDWAEEQQRQVQLSYKENDWWTWCIRK